VQLNTMDMLQRDCHIHDSLARQSLCGVVPAPGEIVVTFLQYFYV
jgi:hypothetical protein